MVDTAAVKGALTRKVGPLPVVAWVGIGVGGFVVFRALTGKGGASSDFTASTAADAYDFEADGGDGTGSGGSSAGGIDTIPTAPVPTVPIAIPDPLTIPGTKVKPPHFPKPTPGPWPNVDTGNIRVASKVGSIPRPKPPTKITTPKVAATKKRVADLGRVGVAVGIASKQAKRTTAKARATVKAKARRPIPRPSVKVPTPKPSLSARRAQ